MKQGCSSSSPAGNSIDMAAEECDFPRCRLCFAVESLEHALVSPCACSGSIKFIHLECLQQWQRALWQQGHYQRTLICDVCRQPYHQCFQEFPVCSSARGCFLSRTKRLLQQLLQWPELAFRVWRCCIMLGGLAAGTQRGMSGLHAGLSVGLKSAKPLATFTARLMPQLGIAAAVLPRIQPLVSRALRCTAVILLAEVAVAGLAGLLCGGVLGFCLGTAGVVRMTFRVAAAVACKATQSSGLAWALLVSFLSRRRVIIRSQ